MDEYLKRQAKLVKVVNLGGGAREQGEKGWTYLADAMRLAL